MLLRFRSYALVLLLSAAEGTIACGGPRAVRGSEVPGLDEQAMGTGLDRRDLQEMLHENLSALHASAVVRRWEGEDRPPVAVLPFRNETSEHVDSALDALSSDIETSLVNAGHVRIVDIKSQPQLIQQIRNQQSDAYNPAEISAWGQQLGARYFVTGKVFSTDERQAGERRVQYYLFMQVLDVETGEILFQNKSQVTKAII